MNPIDLQQPILDSGIRSVNFFNGRLLLGDDLTQERSANREVDCRLGQAIGTGVANGLEVTQAVGSTKKAPMLSVTAGLALNAKGQPLALAEQTDVTLLRADEVLPATKRTFSVCLPPQGGTTVTGTGVYLLVLSPASGSLGRAPANGIDCCNATCNARYVVDGVQFRLIQVPLTFEELQLGNMLRNYIAYKFFGTLDPNYLRVLRDPFGRSTEDYGLLASLKRQKSVTDCDVPLAIMLWTADGGIEFIDQWAVRRRITQPTATQSWSAYAGDRRKSEGEGIFLQFQEHIRDLVATKSHPESISMVDHFSLLPPVGFLPLAKVGPIAGFSYQTFFGVKPIRNPYFVGADKLRGIVETSLSYEPIKARDREMVWLYQVRENHDPTAYDKDIPSQSYIIFTSGHAPFHGNAQADVARADFSNFPPQPWQTGEN